jgi:hypothetical protein
MVRAGINRSMSSQLRKLMRASAAIIAAYALVMQALLGGVLSAKAASVDPFAICVSVEDGAPADHTTHAPQHDHCVLCSVAVHAAPAPQGVALDATRAKAGALIWRAPDWLAPVPFRNPIARPRGPPLAA